MSVSDSSSETQSHSIKSLPKNWRGHGHSTFVLDTREGLRKFLAVLKTYKKLSKGVLLHHAGVEGVRMKQVILDIGTSCGEWSASHPGRAFPPGKDQRYPLVRRTELKLKLSHYKPRRHLAGEDV